MNTDPTNILKFGFSSFEGGMRRNVDPTKLGDTEYPLLINGRTRYGSIRPIKLPQKQSGLPEGYIAQGCYADQGLVFVAVNGEVYLRDYSIANSAFTKIKDIILEAFADYIYAEQVPDSYFNFDRRPSTQETSITGGIDVIEKENGITISSSGIIFQDGTSQPWFVARNLTARKLQKFYQWQVDGVREYVPPGLNMLYHDGILYIVSSDRKQIYRSVTGRPLDFVIAVNKDGDKLSDNLFTEEAERMAHKVNNAAITALAKLNLGPEFQNLGAPFAVSTTSGTFKVTPNLEDTLYGEPKLRNNDIFPTSIRNQFSFAPTKRNDIDFMDETGLRSYNALSEDVSIGRDDNLSGPVFRLFDGMTQTYTCCTFYDNYTLFGVDTVFGPGVLVYDNLLGRFASLDLFDGIGYVKQFCQTNIDGVKRLFFITTTGDFYEYFGSSQTATCKFYTREVAAEDAEVAIKLLRVKLTLQDIEEDGTISATPVVDRRKEATQTRTVTKTLTQESYPQSIPFGASTEDTGDAYTFEFQNSRQADKVGCLVEFNFMCDLNGIQMNCKQLESVVDLKQQAKLYSRT